MKRTMRWVGVGLLFSLGWGVAGVQAQQPVSAEPQAPSRTVQTPPEVVPALPVPRLVKFAGTLKDELGKPRTGVVGVTFAIYKDQEGGAALWLETQNVELDEQGHYTVLLGSSKSEGLPLELFTAGEPRWLGVQVNLPKELEQPRVLLVSVPYALKAADAEMLGGMPASAFVLAAPNGTVAGTGTSDTAVQASANSKTAAKAASRAKTAAAAATIGGGGTQNVVAKFDATGANVVNSSIFDNGQVGIGTTSPGALLDVELTTSAPTNALLSNITLNNSAAINNAVVSAFDMNFLDSSTGTNLSKQTARIAYIREAGATGGVAAFDSVLTATEFLHADAPFPVRGVNIEGPTVDAGKTLGTFYGAYIGSPSGAGTVTNRFALVTEPNAGNVGLGTTAPTQKLEVAGNVKISGGGNALVFPDGSVMSSAATGVGGGTITGIAAGTGLSGGGTSGGVTLGIANGGVTNALLAANSVTNASIADGGLSPAKITGGAATLGANSFIASQTINSGGTALNATSSSPNGTGVSGTVSSTADNANDNGVQGVTASPVGIGVNGLALDTTGGTTKAFGSIGVNGQSNSPNGIGVFGLASDTTAVTPTSPNQGTTGVQGQSNSPAGSGVNAFDLYQCLLPGCDPSVAGAPVPNGLFARVLHANGIAVLGVAGSTNVGCAMPTCDPTKTGSIGVLGRSFHPNGAGVIGIARDSSVTNTAGGVFSAGVFGKALSPTSYALYGYFSPATLDVGAAGLFNNDAGSTAQPPSTLCNGTANCTILELQANGIRKFHFDGAGNAHAAGTFMGGGADFAESVSVRGERRLYDAGDVMVIDDAGNRSLAKAQEPYSTLVAGIVSTKPGVLASLHNSTTSAGQKAIEAEVPLAVVGIVPCKVSAENGPIHAGDLLVTSSLAGYAMKGTDRARMLGAVVGKAMQPMQSGKGIIEVLVTLQ